MNSNGIRIAMLSAHSCPLGNLGARDTGGMSVYVRELARQLGQRGHLVDIYTRTHDPKDDQVYELGPNARLIHLRAGEDRDINKLAVYSHLPDFANNLENFRKQNNLQYDIVFSNYWLSGWVGERLRQWWHVPHVMVFHTLGAVKNDIGIGKAEPELRIKAEAHLAKSCHHLIATTEQEKSDLIHYYGAPAARISVIPCGVNMELFQPGNGEMTRRQLGFGDDKVILCVGRIEPLKGIDRFLQAMTYLRNGGGLRAVIIGGDVHSHTEMKRLIALTRALKIADSVSFLGTVEHDKLPGYYSMASVCVIPSHYESFGLVALEAMACGTPVVASDVGSFKNIIQSGKTGYVLSDDAPSTLADKIALFLSGQDDLSTRSIRESIARFSWSNVAEQVIDEVLARHLVPA